MGDLYVIHVMWMSFVIVLNKDDVKVRDTNCQSSHTIFDIFLIA